MPELALWDWSKGWHPEKPESLLEPGELQDALNVIYRETQVPEKRRGFESLRASFGTGRVDGFVRYKPVGESAYWVFAWSGALYKLLDDGTTPQIGSGLTSGVDYFFDIWRDTLFITNGTDGLFSWDGTTLTDLTNTPPPDPPQPSGFPISGTVTAATSTTIEDTAHSWTAEGVVPGDKVKITSGAGSGQERTISDLDGSTITVDTAWTTTPSVGDTFEVYATVTAGSAAPDGAQFVVHHADRLWLAKTTDAPDQIFYSRLLDEENWNDSETGIDNLIDVSVGDNQPITGMVRAREALIVFKEKAIFYLRGYGPEDWVLDRISDDLGCIAPRSIAQADSTTIWLSHKGVYMDDGQSFKRIGGPVDNWIRENLTPDQQRKATAVIDRLNYILHFPDTAYGPICLVWNGRFDNWTFWQLPLPFSVLARKSDGWAAAHNEKAQFFAGDTGGTDDGTSITARMRSLDIGVGAPQDEHILRRAAVRADVSSGDSLSLQVYAGDAPLGGTSPVVSGGASFVSFPPGLLVRHFSVAVEITGSGSEGTRLHGVTLEVRPRRKRWSG